MNQASQRASAYSKAGVDDKTAQIGLNRMIDRFKTTWPSDGVGTGSVRLSFGHFANVIEVEGIGIAMCTDGVGSKALIAQKVGKYDGIGVDCVAMNVNDLVCVGAKPLSMVDLMAVQSPQPDLLDELSKGLCEGARQANVSISGGEIAQLNDMIKGARKKFGFDLSGTAIGVVELDKIIDGKNVEDGDVVIGVESSGIHSNGLTLARNIFFDQKGFSVNKEFPELDNTLGVELLNPTHIYVKEILEVLAEEIRVKALIHITSDGFLNLLRVVGKEMGYIITELPKPSPIFPLIQSHGNVPISEMFRVYNMGIGFCLVVDKDDTERVLALMRKHNRQAQEIGYACAAKPGVVSITQHHLEGTLKEKRFYETPR